MLHGVRPPLGIWEHHHFQAMICKVFQPITHSMRGKFDSRNHTKLWKKQEARFPQGRLDAFMHWLYSHSWPTWNWGRHNHLPGSPTFPFQWRWFHCDFSCFVFIPFSNGHIKLHNSGGRRNDGKIKTHSHWIICREFSTLVHSSESHHDPVQDTWLMEIRPGNSANNIRNVAQRLGNYFKPERGRISFWQQGLKLHAIWYCEKCMICLH